MKGTVAPSSSRATAASTCWLRQPIASAMRLRMRVAAEEDCGCSEAWMADIDRVSENGKNGEHYAIGWESSSWPRRFRSAFQHEIRVGMPGDFELPSRMPVFMRRWRWRKMAGFSLTSRAGLISVPPACAGRRGRKRVRSAGRARVPLRKPAWIGHLRPPPVFWLGFGIFDSGFQVPDFWTIL